MKLHFEDWAECPSKKGFNGMGPKELAAAERCHDKKILHWNCFIECYRYELGFVKDGKWQDDVARPQTMAMWDGVHQVEAKKWYDDTYNCVKDYEVANTWPMDYTTPEASCASPAMDKFNKCVHDARDVCKQ